MHATLLSFEFYGGYIALEKLKEYGAPSEQAESVAEAIIRHQDLGDIGTITTVGQLIQLATLFGMYGGLHSAPTKYLSTSLTDMTDVIDNAGKNPTLVSKRTIESIIAAYPRKQWSSCFAHTIEKELDLKPWAHSSAIPKFAETVAGNKLMEPWDH